MTYENTKPIDSVILVGIESDNTSAYLAELAELAQTAGAVVVGEMLQNRDRAHPGHYLGKGKLEELRLMIDATDATGIICDDELTSAQMRNLNEILDVKIIDRTMLILDIFAQRALSSEGKLQVELAQLKYSISHLVGVGKAMSRLGGGIGTRGPGETKLETDRRHIRSRMTDLTRELAEIKTHRAQLRTGRLRKGTPLVSLVGYTNAGKSTLLNTLTNAGVLAEDKLFATLDTTTRKVALPGGTNILLADTVGFIRKLPHKLIQAFQATLEELSHADILLNVVDASGSEISQHIEVVRKTLADLNLSQKPLITVYNKMDRAEETPSADSNSYATVRVSALSGNGLPNLLAEIETLLNSFKTTINVVIPYSDGSMLGLIHGNCEILEENHLPEGTHIRAYASDEIAGRLSKYVN